MLTDLGDASEEEEKNFSGANTNEDVKVLALASIGKAQAAASRRLKAQLEELLKNKVTPTKKILKQYDHTTVCKRFF